MAIDFDILPNGLKLSRDSINNTPERIKNNDDDLQNSTILNKSKELETEARLNARKNIQLQTDSFQSRGTMSGLQVLLHTNSSTRSKNPQLTPTPSQHSEQSETKNPIPSGKIIAASLKNTLP